MPLFPPGNGFQLPAATKNILENSDYILIVDSNGTLYKITKTDFFAASSSATTSTSSDVNFNSVSFLLHFNGINGSRSFSDIKGHAITPYGNAQISTTKSNFNSSSLLLGSGDYLDVVLDSSLALSGSDFSLEAWVYPLNSSDMMIMSSTPAIANIGYAMTILAGKLRFESGGGSPSLISNLSVAANMWQHLAICRSLNDYYFAVNGIVEKIPNSAAWADSDGLRIGANRRFDYAYYFTGYINDLRITKGIARYTSNFTPQIQPFANS